VKKIEQQKHDEFCDKLYIHRMEHIRRCALNKTKHYPILGDSYYPHIEMPWILEDNWRERI
jgi:hypothetical protein